MAPNNSRIHSGERAGRQSSRSSQRRISNSLFIYVSVPSPKRKPVRRHLLFAAPRVIVGLSNPSPDWGLEFNATYSFSGCSRPVAC